MITLCLARSPATRLRLLELLYETDDPDQPPFDLLETQFETFGRCLMTSGELYGIFRGRQPVGFCWARRRGRSLHVLGLQIRPSCRGCGTGSQALRLLVSQAPPETRILELDVHRSNRRAFSLYHRLGFTPSRYDPYSGLYLLRKHRQPRPLAGLCSWRRRQVADTGCQPEGIGLVGVAHCPHREHQPDLLAHQ
jgi:ribosomal protein S18 acetylase RimI-like enzyme